MTPSKINVETTVTRPLSQVWTYWTEPQHITGWNFASDDWQCPHAENDVRPGGKYAARMEAKDGSFGFDFEATYDTVDRPHGMRYTMTDGRQATTHFEEADNGTRVTIVFDAEGQNSEDMQRAGWQAILDNFRKYAESQAAA